MRAALAYALRRTSARIVVALGVGGLFVVVYRALHQEGPRLATNLGGTRSYFFPPMSSHWDLAIASIGLLIAIAAAVALHRRFSASSR